MLAYENVKTIFNKWLDILRLRNNWDFKVDPDDRKAILMINA